MRNQRLVLVPCPYQGHINPMLQLAKALHSKGFSITIAHTVFNSPNNGHPDFTFVALPDGLSGCEFTSTDPLSTVLAINENCRAEFKACVQRVIEQAESRGEAGTAWVIADEFMFFAEDVANELALPSAVLRTTSAATSLARSGLVKLTEQGRLVRQGTKTVRFIFFDM